MVCDLFACFRMVIGILVAVMLVVVFALILCNFKLTWFTCMREVYNIWG